MKNRSLSALLIAGLVAGAGCSEGSTAFTPGNRDDQHPPLNDQTPPTRLCEDFCRKIPTLCREADCVKECLANAGQRCQVEALAAVRCLAYRASVACEAEQLGDGPIVFTPTFVGCDAELAAYERCSDPGTGEGGASGRGGAGGRAGEGGMQGEGGTAGDGGMAGDGGTAGDAGAAGMSGAAGTGGVAGTGGDGGTDDGGPDAVAGRGGVGGSSGAAGSAGTDAGGGTGGTGGSGGQCALPDCTGCADQCQTCVCNNAGDSGACSLDCVPDSGMDSGTDASGD